MNFAAAKRSDFRERPMPKPIPVTYAVFGVEWSAGRMVTAELSHRTIFLLNWNARSRQCLFLQDASVKLS